MEKWNKPSRDHRKQHQRENPSFSSSLLDVIYRSIDEGHHKTEEKEEKPMFYRETTSTTMRKMKSVEAEKPNFRKARKVENWNEKVVNGRNSLTEFETRTTRSNSNTLSMHSSSSSSESSSAGGFSSSDSESFYGLQKPKPIRTSVSEKPNIDSFQYGYSRNHNYNHNHNHSVQTQKPKNENGLGKTKSKALRILYGDLKKTKQPISPGAKIASFLNSLFNSSGNTKKSKIPSSTATKTTTNSVLEAKSAQASTCSSVSSFSRSCLSKTPSSRSGAKRSVRFCPVSVIVDEDCRPCGHKNLHEGEKGSSIYDGKSSSEELRLHVMQESLRVEELARDLLKNYQKKNEVDFNMQFEDDEDEDDDGASCASSDLFELDNLSVIGIERYREELPVYETTHFNPNRVIGNGFIM